jgi:hypothetical protein
MIVDRAAFLRVYGTDPARWALRHGLQPFTHPCIDCGAPRTTSIPFVSGEYRGLVAETCACGNDLPPYCIVRHGGGDLTTGGIP